MSGFPFGSSSSASSQFTPFIKPPVFYPATSTGFSWSSAPAFGSSSPSSAVAHSFGFRSSAATSAPSSWFGSSPSTVSASSSPLIGSASASASSLFSSTFSAPSPLFGSSSTVSSTPLFSSTSSSSASTTPSSLFRSSSTVSSTPLFSSASSSSASTTPSSLFGSSSTVSSTPLFSSSSSSSASTTPSFPSFSFPTASPLSKPTTTSTPITPTPSATASSFSCAPSTSSGSQPSFVFSDTASSPAPISFAKPTSLSFSTRFAPLFSTVSTTSASSTPTATTTTQVFLSLPAFGTPPTTSAVSSTVAKASMAAPANSAAPSGTSGLTGFGVSSAAASSTGFSLLTKWSTPASSSQAQPSTTVPAFGVTTAAPVVATTTTQTSTSPVEASTSGTTSTVSTTISTAPKLPSEITGKTVEEAPPTSFKHETSYPITTSGPSATSDCSKLVEQSTLAAEVQISTAISPVLQPSSLDFDALDLEAQLALICGGSSSSGFTPSDKAQQAISRINLWQAKDFAVEEGHQSVGELINNLQILAEENLIPKSIFSSGVTSAQEFQHAADLWGTIHTSFEQAITCRDVCQRSTENLEKSRSQCSAQDLELQNLKVEAQGVEAEIAKLQTQLKAIKTKEKEVRIKLQLNLRDAWELQKQITTAQPGLEESHALILRGSKLRADMDAKNGVQQRRNSYQDGVYGTTCPIPPGKNFTYTLQVKDQIGSFYYFPSLAFHKAAGGFGAIKILSRPRIPVPFPDPAGDYSILIGDWYKTDHKILKGILDRGHRLPYPDGIIINGRGPNGTYFTFDQGKTYRLRISNVGLQNSLNFRIQGHKLKLVEVEGTHTIQTTYDSLDIHVGQSYSVLVTADQAPQDYYIAVSTRFTSQVLTSTAVFHYSNSARQVSGPIPAGPTTQTGWSLSQALSIRTNLTASGPRPNPQGSYHYGLVNVSRTIKLESSAAQVSGKQRYAVNSVSFIPADTPLKLADYFKIGGVFKAGSISDNPTGQKMYLDTSVMGADFRAFVEIVFQNHENILQSWHLDGYAFWVVGMDGGKWTPASRNQYNLRDAVSRSTTQVYPKSWTAIYIALDNVGMWNLRSEFWARQYLGQQFYLRVYSPVESARDEYPIPRNALLCGRAAGRSTRP